MATMTEPADPQSAPTAEDTPAIDNPALAFVKGGTGTAASERLYMQRQYEAEQRREEASRERALAADQQKVDLPGQEAPVHMPGHAGGGVMYTSQMTAHPEIPKGYILLQYLSRTGSKTGLECLVDLIVGANPDKPTDLCIVLVCPRCQENSHKFQQDNQLRIFQSNKHFEFVAGKGPETFVFMDPETGIEGVYKSAGMVVASEPFRCGDCGWRARIEMNFVRPD
jgi:hypothetical protein